MKIQPIKTDNLPRARCTPEERSDYDQACKLENVNINSNARDVIMDWVKRIFKKHGVESKRVLGKK